MHFPFEHGPTYTIGALRMFERDLSAARQADRALSNAWRIPTTPDMKRWGKIREETYPIKLLADHKGYPDEATFQLRPVAFPGVDADIDARGEQFNLQITIADPIWGDADARVQHGGYDNRLLLEALNRQGFVHGSGNFRRDGDQIVCDEPVKGGSDRADACRQALVAALTRKAKPKGQTAARLLIYARGFTVHIVDEGFATVAAEAVQKFEQISGQRVPFDAVYFVEEREFAEA